MEEGDQTKGKMKKMGKLAMAVTEAEYDDTLWEVRRLYGSQQASTSYVPPKRPSIPTGPPPKPPEPVPGFNEYGFVKPVECWPVGSPHCLAAKAAGAKSK